MHEEMMAKKNECIGVLKKEIETLNEIVNSLRNDNIEKEIEGNSMNKKSKSFDLWNIVYSGLLSSWPKIFIP